MAACRKTMQGMHLRHRAEERRTNAACADGAAGRAKCCRRLIADYRAKLPTSLANAHDCPSVSQYTTGHFAGRG